MSDDAAHVNWGGSWRMPTIAELKELRKKCTWTVVQYKDGVRALKVTSKINGNSIILPAANSCRKSYGPDSSLHYDYWSSSLTTKHPHSAGAIWGFAYKRRYEKSRARADGLTVRPVCP